MPVFILEDGLHFGQACICGAMLAVAYDFLRIFRRVVVHRRIFWSGVEDILFWIYAGIQLFLLSFETRAGVVRLFLLIGAVIGAIIYECILGRFLVKFVSKIIKIPLKKLKSCFTMLLLKVRGLRIKGRDDRRGNRQKKA